MSGEHERQFGEGVEDFKFDDEEGPDDSLGLFRDGELEGESERLTPQKLWERIKDRIVDVVPDFIISRDQIVDDFTAKLSKSVILSKAGGMLFHVLAERGLTKPTQNHEYQDRESNILDSGAFIRANLEAIQKDNPRKSQSFKAQKEYLHWSVDARFEAQPAHFTVEREADYDFEFRGEIVDQDGGQNTVEEVIHNKLYDNRNMGVSVVTVHNKQTRQSLELNELLPEGFRLTPDGLHEYKDALVVEGEGLDRKLSRKRIFIPKSLNDYPGMKSTDGDFSAHHGINEVRYGNLSEKGGVLSFLHEAAHAWQSKHLARSGRMNWENYKMSIDAHLRMLIYTVEQLQSSYHTDKIDLNDFKQLLTEAKEVCRKDLNELGVELSFEDIDPNKLLGKDEYRLTTKTSVKIDEEYYNIKQKFNIKSDKVKPLVEDFVREERDAWAHAIKVLRFYRRNGFDLEPEHFNQISHEALGSYQVGIESEIDPTNHIRNFTRKSRFKMDPDTELI